jgi:hypothetical protein
MLLYQTFIFVIDKLSTRDKRLKYVVEHTNRHMLVSAKNQKD